MYALIGLYMCEKAAIPAARPWDTRLVYAQRELGPFLLVLVALRRGWKQHVSDIVNDERES